MPRRFAYVHASPATAARVGEATAAGLARLLERLEAGEVLAVTRTAGSPTLRSASTGSRPDPATRAEARRRARTSGGRGGRPCSLTAGQRALVLRRLQEGATVSALAREFGTSRQTITRVRDGPPPA